MPAVKLTFPQGSEELLSKLPHMVREQTVKKAIRRATIIVEKESRIRARGLKRVKKHKKNIGEELHKNIKRQTVKTDGNKVKGQVRSVDNANKYAAAVEFGHVMSGKYKHLGGDVPKYPFMRPAIDHTEEAQKAIIISTLKEDIDKYLG